MHNTKDLLYKLKTFNLSSNIDEYDHLLHLIKNQTDVTPNIFNKILTSCIRDPGWILCGADFSSLEDRISALTTKDPMKLKVYEDGYDGHNLRAFSYFCDIMVDIKDKMAEATLPQKFFKITHTSGEIEYASEAELNNRRIKIPN